MAKFNYARADLSNIFTVNETGRTMMLQLITPVRKPLLTFILRKSPVILHQILEFLTSQLLVD